ncbi:hypothetical protein SUGI_0469550 [Cryptomeria japonica]|nr:hypothetical protein SUGI_0469550 [Cryptomeria japonica]
MKSLRSDERGINDIPLFYSQFTGCGYRSSAISAIFLAAQAAVFGNDQSRKLEFVQRHALLEGWQERRFSMLMQLFKSFDWSIQAESPIYYWFYFEEFKSVFRMAPIAVGHSISDKTFGICRRQPSASASVHCLTAV